jgi:hypothetical protein
MVSYSIADMRAIGPFYAGKLKAVGIRSTRKLLERTRTPRDRKQLAETAAIPPENILRWAKIADLMRIRGVAEDYAELLGAAGADTVRELARRNAARLVARMAELNANKKIVDLLPSEKRVTRWIDEAKALEPMITY